MEQNHTTDPKLVQGFNDGYIIAKYEPGLMEKLSKIEAVSSYLIGLQQGGQEYQKEQLKDKLPSYLKDNPTENKTKLPSKDQDKGVDKD